MEFDYLIVGAGLAGISFAEIALTNNKSIFVINNNAQNSSLIAGGLYNPVILKRFSEVWNAKEQIILLNEFYAKIEFKLNDKFDNKVPILRKFFSTEEQNNWFIASDKPNLSPFLSTQLITRKFNNINSPFNYGEVLQTGYVNTGHLIKCYQDYLKAKDIFLFDSFDYNLLEIFDDKIRYNNIIAKHIVFAEGFGMIANPFFNYLPLDGTKGELFTIKAPLLDINVIINTSIFILPIGNDLFKVGATYDWVDKTDIPTDSAKQELITKIKEIISCDFEIIDHFAGVRPTVKDRKPLVGTHNSNSNIHILNGLGTRGVMLAPAMAKTLFNNIEFNEPIDKVVDIKRFDKRN